MTEQMNKAAESLRRHGYEVYCVATAADAAREALRLIEPGWSVGVGGSMTVRELGLVEALTQRGHDVWWHWTTPGEKGQVWANARSADVYLASANALTTSGQLVNIDGTGNRVASLIHGPAAVLMIIGAQKVVEGGLSAAIARIKREACPPNASRLKLNTPCAHTGRCNEAECGDDCMCRAITVMQRPLRGQRAMVVLVDEPIGY